MSLATKNFIIRLALVTCLLVECAVDLRHVTPNSSEVRFFSRMGFVLLAGIFELGGASFRAPAVGFWQDPSRGGAWLEARIAGQNTTLLTLGGSINGQQYLLRPSSQAAPWTTRYVFDVLLRNALLTKLSIINYYAHLYTMKLSSLSLVTLLHVSCPATAEYVWPSELDEIEDLLSLQSGYIRNGFIDGNGRIPVDPPMAETNEWLILPSLGVNPCSFNSHNPGRQTAAEWVRTVFHDIATHDATAGTGGLDASIMFETEREENVGAAFNGTLGFMVNFHTVKSSAADLLALGVVTVLATCGGPQLPFRAGRVDAREAGSEGVPLPEQDLATHTDQFAKAGFNTSDMIAMVACGHSLGGVHGNNFPNITGNSSEEHFVHFENKTDSFAEFDNAVVTEYFDGTSTNLLLIGANDTTNSDKRVFGADGNVTMEALTDPAEFERQCQSILTRMLDTVPAAVKLTEPITPFDVKPHIGTLALNSDGSRLDFIGRIRVRTSDSTGRDPDDIAVRLTYSNRAGAGVSAPISTVRPSLMLGMSTGLFGERFTWYEFNTTLDAVAGVSKFDVHLTTISTNTTVVHDNGGAGFPLTDAVLYQLPQSCLNTTAVDGNMDLTVTAAVHKNQQQDGGLKLNLVNRVPRQGVIVPALETHEVAFQDTGSSKGDYRIFRSRLQIDAENWATTFDITLGDGKDGRMVEFLPTSVLAAQTCEEL